MLAASDALIERGGFSWAGIAGDTPEETTNPWLLLRRQARRDLRRGRPWCLAIVDFNTAMYSLHKGLGDTIDVRRRPRPTHAGCGSWACSRTASFKATCCWREQAFLELFPDMSGYRFFLVDTRSEPERSRSP